MAEKKNLDKGNLELEKVRGSIKCFLDFQSRIVETPEGATAENLNVPLEKSDTLDSAIDIWEDLATKDGFKYLLSEPDYLEMLQVMKITSIILHTAARHKDELKVLCLLWTAAAELDNVPYQISAITSLADLFLAFGYLELAKNLLHHIDANLLSRHKITKYELVTKKLVQSRLCLRAEKFDMGYGILSELSRDAFRSGSEIKCVILLAQIHALSCSYLQTAFKPQKQTDQLTSEKPCYQLARAVVTMESFIKNPKVSNAPLLECFEFQFKMVQTMLQSSYTVSEMFLDMGLLRKAKVFVQRGSEMAQGFQSPYWYAKFALLSTHNDFVNGDVNSCKTKLNSLLRSFGHCVQKVHTKQAQPQSSGKGHKDTCKCRYCTDYSVGLLAMEVNFVECKLSQATGSDSIQVLEGLERVEKQHHRVKQLRKMMSVLKAFPVCKEFTKTDIKYLPKSELSVLVQIACQSVEINCSMKDFVSAKTNVDKAYYYFKRSTETPDKMFPKLYSLVVYLEASVDLMKNRSIFDKLWPTHPSITKDYKLLDSPTTPQRTGRSTAISSKAPKKKERIPAPLKEVLALPSDDEDAPSQRTMINEDHSALQEIFKMPKPKAGNVWLASMKSNSTFLQPKVMSTTLSERKPAKPKTKKAEAKNKDIDVFESEEEKFSLPKISTKIQNCVTSLINCPIYPLYGQLCKMLAMVTLVEKPKDEVDRVKKNWTAAYYFNESLCVSLKHHAMTTPDKKMKDKPWDIFTVFDFLHDTDPVDAMKEFGNCIPEDMVVAMLIQIDETIYKVDKDPRTSDPNMIICRFMKGSLPIFSGIRKSQLSTCRLVDAFDEISNESLLSMKEKEAKVWWNWRYGLNDRLKEVLQSVENQWLMSSKCYLLGRPVSPLRKTQIDGVVDDLSGVPLGLDKEVLQIIVDSSPMLDDDELLHLLQNVWHYADNANRQHVKLEDVCSMIRSASRNFLDSARHPVVLMLDNKDILRLPFESLPFLRNNEICRLPSFHFLKYLINFYPQAGISYQKTFYLLNPSGDLKKTENTFKDCLSTDTKYITWKGITGRIPTVEEYKDSLSNYDMMLYLGHGTGRQFISKENIERLHCNASLILMGCSSCRLRNGILSEAMGDVVSYLIGGCPCVIGNLWDVTDKDIDLYTKKLLDSLLPEDTRSGASNILSPVSSSRDWCKLPYLTGAAPVLYGLPVSITI